MKKKIFLSLAAILALASLSGCNTTSDNENPYYDSESDTEVVHDVDRETAQVVIDMIDALDEDSTKEEILAALDAYNQLTKRQQSFVHNYEKLLEQIEKMEKDGTFDVLPKKEVIELRKEYEKLNKLLCGIRAMDKLPQAMIIVDPKKEINAIREARKLNIPVVGLVDTNCYHTREKQQGPTG